MAGQIDFGILKTPNIFGGAMDTYRMAQEDTAARDKDLRTEQYAARKDQREQALADADLRQTTQKTGYEAAAKKIEFAGRMASAMESRFPQPEQLEDRKAFALSVADEAAQYGITPDQLAADDYSLENVRATIAKSLGAAEIFQQKLDRERLDISRTPRAPSGYQYGDDGEMTYIPNGPADPNVIGRSAGVRRDAVVSRPAPRRASGGGRSGSAPSTSPASTPSRRVLGANLDPNDGW